MIALGFVCFMLMIACIANYMRASRLEDEIASLKLHHSFTSNDLNDLVKEVGRLVNWLLNKKDGTTQDH